MDKGIIAIDIGGSHITSVMIGNLKKGDFITPFQHDKINSGASRSAILQGWYKNILSTITEAPDVFSNQVAIAIPSPFDYEKGIGLYSNKGKFASLNNTNIREALQSLFKQDMLFHFENDAACFGLGESHFGKTASYNKSMAITLGTGIGCTFISNNEVVKNGLDVPLDGEVYHLPFEDGIADEYFSTRWFVKRAKEKYGLQVKGVKELIEQSRPVVYEYIFTEFANNLLGFLLPIANKFQTGAIVFGGNISKAWPYFSKPLKAGFAKHGINILSSGLNEKAICLGAAQSLNNLKTKETFL